MTLSAEGEPGGESDSSTNGIADPAEVCGCAAQCSGAGTLSESSAHVETTPDDPQHENTIRELKVVAILRPDGAGYLARLAAGAEGCDPELRVAHVPDLAAALVTLNEVSAAAEARWRVQRRYPPAPRPQPAPRQRAGTSTASSLVGADRPTGSQVGAQSAQTIDNASASDQLSLFG